MNTRRTINVIHCRASTAFGGRKSCPLHLFKFFEKPISIQTRKTSLGRSDTTQPFSQPFSQLLTSNYFVHDFSSANTNSTKNKNKTPKKPQQQKRTSNPQKNKPPQHQKTFCHHKLFLGSGHAKLVVCAAGHVTQG